MNEKKVPRLRLSLIMVLILAVIFGFLAGVVGELWVNAFLVQEVRLRSFEDLTKRLDDLTAQKNKDVKELLSEQDFSINKIVEKIKPTVVKFYPYKKSDGTLNSVYLDNEVLGAGFVFTSDGWLITSKKVLTDSKKDYSAQVGGEIYKVEKMIFDSITDAVFVKVTADNLTVADLSTKNTLNFGQSALVASATDGMIRTTIDDLYRAASLKQSDLIRSSETFYRFISIKGDYENSNLGAPVFDLDGKVIGLMTATDGLVLPVDYFSSIMKSAVQKNQINRGFLGVNFLDLELAPNFLSQFKQGALIMGDAARKAVVVGSPAASALQSGDIIVKIENDEINKTYTLPEAIQDYVPGTEINLTVMRAGKEITVGVTLGELK
jgi:serine protease Do